MVSPTEKAIIAKLRDFSAEKQREVLDFASFLRAKKTQPKLKSARGLWKDMGFTISEEDIVEARKEMWDAFPREEFFK